VTFVGISSEADYGRTSADPHRRSRGSRRALGFGVLAVDLIVRRFAPALPEIWRRISLS
jgi:hypothetical protein